MPFFALLLAALSTAALFTNHAFPVRGTSLALMVLAVGAGLGVGMGRWQPALALALTGGVAILALWTTPGLVLLAAAGGAAWGPREHQGVFWPLPLMAVGMVGVGAALASDGIFDPVLAAGLASVGLLVLPLVRVPIPVAALVGAAVGFSWGLGGFAGAGILAGLAMAITVACARRVPGRGLATAAGLMAGGGAGGLLGMMTGAPTTLTPALQLPASWIALMALAALVVCVVRRGIPNSHPFAILVGVVVASLWAPEGAAPGLAITALVCSALAASPRASLFASANPTPSAPSSSPLFPWVRRAWRARPGPSSLFTTHRRAP